MKAILLRTIPSEHEQIIEEYKSKRYVKTNTEAVLRLIKEGAKAQEDYQRLMDERHSLNSQYERLLWWVEKHLDLKKQLDHTDMQLRSFFVGDEEE